MTMDRIEVITSVERRRRWSAAEKARLVAAMDDFPTSTPRSLNFRCSSSRVALGACSTSSRTTASWRASFGSLWPPKSPGLKLPVA